MRTRLLAVIVLYGTPANRSASYQSLLHAMERAPNSAIDLRILLYDNTPEAEPPAVLPGGVSYIAAKENRGLSSAYNYALDQALERGDEWLMTLDQDTSLPEDLLLQIEP